jgi:hypothetical protein
MFPFERDSTKQTSSTGDPADSADSADPGDSRRDTSTSLGSNADAEDSAAHIAELVRRTAARQAMPGPSSVAGSPAMVTRQPPMPAVPVAPPIAPPLAHRVTEPDAAPARRSTRRPSRRALVVAGAVAVFLVGGVGGGLALSNPFGSDGVPTAAATPAAPATATAPAVQNAAPTGYAVKVTDVITDCTGHSRGLTRTSFEKQNCVRATRLLATGQVSGRPALYVVSRIQMASAEAAATVKQVLDGSGTGNLNDLLRDGKTFPGAPAKMPSSGYTSVQSGKVVTVAEAGFVDAGRSSSTDPALRAAAAQVAALVNAQG